MSRLRRGAVLIAATGLLLQLSWAAAGADQGNASSSETMKQTETGPAGNAASSPAPAQTPADKANDSPTEPGCPLRNDRKLDRIV